MIDQSGFHRYVLSCDNPRSVADVRITDPEADAADVLIRRRQEHQAHQSAIKRARTAAAKEAKNAALAARIIAEARQSSATMKGKAE